MTFIAKPRLHHPTLQTNAVGLGKPGAWGDVPNSPGHSQMTFPTNDPKVPIKFFRLRHP